MLSIIIPTYNERENIIPLVRKILSVLSDDKIKSEIIIVDDNSNDDTELAVLEEFRSNRQVRLFVRKKERGLATAVLFGIKKSAGDIIIGMDADFNHPPELIPELVKNLTDSDLIVASRFIKGGGMEDKYRYFFTYLFNLFLKNILGFPTMDNMSGFYAIKKIKLMSLLLDKIYTGYGEYHLKLVYLAKINEIKISEIPVFYQKRSYGKSKTNFFKYFFVYLWTALRLRFTKIG